MKRVYFRFYEELNDFLSIERIKVEFEHEFWGIVAVKDMIQSFGVPHTEIDLILVNGTSVGFDYIVNDLDRFSVYPVFESFDIGYLQKLRSEPLRNPKFILDVHLGKLARSMRLMGFDTLYKNTFNDEEIVTISNEQKRTILTRDLGILKRNMVDRGYWLRNTDPKKQILEVLKRFHLLNEINEFSRCISCNGLLMKIEKSTVENFVPLKVFNFYEKFYACSDCKKIYWKGSHYREMKNKVSIIKQNVKRVYDE